MRILLVLLIAVRSMAATIVLPDLERSTFLSNVISASVDDTLLFPAGSNKWISTARITNKTVTVKGAGRGVTIITDAAADLGTGHTLMGSSSQGTNFVRFSDFTLYADPIDYSWGLLRCDATGGDATNTGTFAVERMGFMALKTRGMTCFGENRGLVRSCYFQALTDGTQQGVTCWSTGTTNWNSGPNWGSPRKMYIEDCIFDFVGPSDSGVELYYGAEAVIRFCYFTNCISGMHGLDSASWAAGGSSKSREFYGNILDITVNQILLENRGGAELTFSNNWFLGGSVTATAIVLEAYRSRLSPDLCSSFAQGCITGSNPYDGNTLGIGYPGAQLPGTTGPFLGDGIVSGSIGLVFTSWIVEPCWGWENYRVKGGVTNSVIYGTNNVGIPTIMVAGRDHTNGVAKAGVTLLPYPHYLASVVGGARGLRIRGIKLRP